MQSRTFGIAIAVASAVTTAWRRCSCEVKVPSALQRDKFTGRCLPPHVWQLPSWSLIHCTGERPATTTITKGGITSRSQEPFNRLTTDGPASRFSSSASATPRTRRAGMPCVPRLDLSSDPELRLKASLLNRFLR